MSILMYPVIKFFVLLRVAIIFCVDMSKNNVFNVIMSTDNNLCCPLIMFHYFFQEARIALDGVPSIQHMTSKQMDYVMKVSNKILHKL